MFQQIKNSLVVASSNARFKIAVQLIIFALLLIAALVQPDAAFANPSWGNVGGQVFKTYQNIMTKITVNAIATRALVDKNFEAAILNGQRRELLQEFQLPEKVFNAIMCIQGEDLNQFIYQLNDLVASPSMMQ